jgi:hypothetical protein
VFSHPLPNLYSCLLGSKILVNSNGLSLVYSSFSNFSTRSTLTGSLRLTLTFLFSLGVSLTTFLTLLTFLLVLFAFFVAFSM